MANLKEIMENLGGLESELRSSASCVDDVIYDLKHLGTNETLLDDIKDGLFEIERLAFGYPSSVDRKAEKHFIEIQKEVAKLIEKTR